MPPVDVPRDVDRHPGDAARPGRSVGRRGRGHARPTPAPAPSPDRTDRRRRVSRRPMSTSPWLEPASGADRGRRHPGGGTGCDAGASRSRRGGRAGLGRRSRRRGRAGRRRRPPTAEDQSATARDRRRPSSPSTPRPRGRRDGAATLWESPDGTPTASLPWLQARSPDDRICPFLRAVAADDHLGFPVESPDAANRCASMHEAVPQSLRQQELVCLTSNHVNCPRYLRGAAETAAVVPVARGPPEGRHDPGHQCRADHPGAVIRSIGRVRTRQRRARRCRRALPSRRRAPRPRRSPRRPTASPASSSPRPRVVGRRVAEPRADAGPVGHAHPVAERHTRSRPPVASASAATGPTPTPTSSRYRLLKPCPNKPNCWIYTVRAGRQPVQHREVLRRAAEHGPSAQPVDQDREPPGWQEADPAAADALAIAAAARTRPAVDDPVDWRRRSISPAFGRSAQHADRRCATGRDLSATTGALTALDGATRPTPSRDRVICAAGRAVGQVTESSAVADRADGHRASIENLRRRDAQTAMRPRRRSPAAARHPATAPRPRKRPKSALTWGICVLGCAEVA